LEKKNQRKYTTEMKEKNRASRRENRYYNKCHELQIEMEKNKKNLTEKCYENNIEETKVQCTHNESV
jgi:hypothetical protein